MKDLTAIGPIQSTPMVITAALKTPVATYRELVALAQPKNGQVSMASAGNGSSNHLAMELLMRQANLPTLVEMGVTNFEVSTFTGLFGPAGMPAPVLERLAAALKKALSVDAVRERYTSMGVEVMDMKQGEFAAFVKTDFEKWRNLAREANIVIE